MATSAYQRRIEAGVARYHQLYPQGVTGQGATQAEAMKFARGHLLTPEHGRVASQSIPGGREIRFTVSTQAADRTIAQAARAGQRISVAVWDKNHPLGSKPLETFRNLERPNHRGAKADWIRDEIKKQGGLKPYLLNTKFQQAGDDSEGATVSVSGLIAIQITVYP